MWPPRLVGTKRCTELPDGAVYLHYLDRELNNAAGYRIAANDLIRYTRLLTLFTSADLYCGLSAIYENEMINNDGLTEFEHLIAADQLATVSHELTRGEFLESRRTAYDHDAVRYPRYFTSAENLSSFVPLRTKSTGSTVPLHNSLLLWSDRDRSEVGVYRPTPIAVQEPVLHALQQRESQAITWSYFSPRLGDLAESASAEATVRRKISEAFTSDYMEYGQGDIATGIPRLHAFDRLSKSFPLYDIRLLGLIAFLCGADDLVDPHRTGADTVASLYRARRQDPGFLRATLTVQWLLDGLYSHDHDTRPPSRGPADPQEWASQESVRGRLQRDLQIAAQRSGKATPVSNDTDAVYDTVYVVLQAMARALEDSNKVLPAYFEIARGRLAVNTTCDVLLLTVTDVESAALDSALTDAGGRSRTQFARINTYTIWDGVGGIVIATARSGMSSRGADGATLTAREAIDDLRPSAVISVGLAFGFDEADQPIGQVLVSAQLIDYELQKIQSGPGGATKIVERGSRTDAHPRMIGRFRGSGLGSAGFNVKIGPMLSGDKLIDNASFRDQLRTRFPEAIGGEMEGAGIRSAADRDQVQWLVVKAVCDYAAQKATNKLARQEIAAREAARAVVYVLRRGGLVPL